jgi:hypothetical protein
MLELRWCLFAGHNAATTTGFEMLLFFLSLQQAPC